MFVYFDNSATTRQLDAVTEAVYRTAKEEFGNPSSLHRLGVRSEKILKQARRSAAALLHAEPEEVFFCSGGTEADNTAVFGAARAGKRRGNKIITSSIEHPAVLEACRQLQAEGFEVVFLPVDRDGIVDLRALEEELDDNTILVSIMHVNNESGAIQPVAGIGRMVREQGKALFHCDAVQSYGKIPIDVRAAGIHLLSASGHKIHGPKGTGILYIRKGVHIPSFQYGGGQERGFRSGTENVPGIAGFGVAAEEAAKRLRTDAGKIRAMGERLAGGIRERIGDITINSPVEAVRNGESVWLPNIVNVTFHGCRGEVLLHMLEQSEIFVSTGSACSSHKKGFSHVLLAMGCGENGAEGAVRFSLSYLNEPEEVEYVLDRLAEAVEQHRKMMKIANRMGR